MGGRKLDIHFESDTGGWPQLLQYNLGSGLPASSALKPPSLIVIMSRDSCFHGRTLLRSVKSLSPTATTTGGILSSAGHWWEEGKRQIRQKENPVTMEISPILLWELEHQSTLCLGSSCNRLSERSLW